MRGRVASIICTMSQPPSSLSRIAGVLALGEAKPLASALVVCSYPVCCFVFRAVVVAWFAGGSEVGRVVARMRGVGAGVAGHGAIGGEVLDVVDHIGDAYADAWIPDLALMPVPFEYLPTQAWRC